MRRSALPPRGLQAAGAALALRTPGGGRVAVHRFAPQCVPLGVVVVGGAMGVPQSHYAPFARWLAAQGWLTLSFDFRSQGESLPLGPSLRASQATLNDWAADYEAVVAHARALLPHGPLMLVGHSLGAQLPGMFERPERVDGMVAVATGIGYWRLQPPGLRRRAPLFWWGIVPVAMRLAGYFPGQRLGMVGDLPRGVMRQWRRWCLHPEYSVGVEGPAVRARYARVDFPIQAFVVTDDEMLSEASLRALLRLYAQAPNTVQHVAPQAAGLGRIGHLGWFRRSSEAALWPLVATALRRPGAKAHA